MPAPPRLRSTTRVLGQAFVNTQSTYFNATYGGFNDSQFINALYVNIGGNAGDPGGLPIGQNLLAQAEARRRERAGGARWPVGQFVHDLIDVDLTPGAAALGLTAAQYQDAVNAPGHHRQQDCGVAGLLERFAAAGWQNSRAQRVGDAAYKVAITVIQGVTSDPTTVTVAITWDQQRRGSPGSHIDLMEPVKFSKRGEVFATATHDP